MLSGGPVVVMQQDKEWKIYIDGKEYQLTQNMGQRYLHGGKEGLIKDMEVVLVNEYSNPVLELKDK